MDTIMVRNLPAYMDWTGLKEVFCQYGEILYCEIQGRSGDRPVRVLWVQDLPRPWQDPRQGRWQELQVPQKPHPQGPHAEEEPQGGHLDRVVQAQAQEGARGGDCQET